MISRDPSRRRWRRWMVGTFQRHPLAVVVAVLMVAACGAVVIRLDGEPSGTVTGEAGLVVGWTPVDPLPWPSMSLDGVERLNGADADLPEGVVIVNFWASTCAPCREEMPVLEKAAQSGTVGVLGVSRDVQAGFAQETLEQRSVTYPNVVDTQARLTEAVGTHVPLVALPSSLLVVDGTIRAIHVGVFESVADVEEAVVDLAS